MERLEWSAWKRRELADFFGRLDCPFYSVAFRVDVTRLFAHAKAERLSVYHSVLWASMRAVNAVDAFLYKLRDGGVVRHDFLSPSFVEPTEGDLFKIVNVDWRQAEPLDAFCARVKAKSDAQERFIDEAAEARDDFVYVSCLPWIDFTALTNETSFDRDDCVPRLTWGRITEGADGRRTMAYSVQANHRVLDGRHIGQFSAALQAELDAF